MLQAVSFPTTETRDQENIFLFMYVLIPSCPTIEVLQHFEANVCKRAQQRLPKYKSLRVSPSTSLAELVSRQAFHLPMKGFIVLAEKCRALVSCSQFGAPSVGLCMPSSQGLIEAGCLGIWPSPRLLSFTSSPLHGWWVAAPAWKQWRMTGWTASLYNGANLNGVVKRVLPGHLACVCQLCPVYMALVETWAVGDHPVCPPLNKSLLFLPLPSHCFPPGYIFL